MVTESYHLKIKAIEITLLNVANKEVRKQSSFTTLFKRNRILKNSKSTLKNVSSFFLYRESVQGQITNSFKVSEFLNFSRM